MFNQTPPQELILGTVLEVGVSKDGQCDIALVVQRLEGRKLVVGRTDGDCCSESWWADVIGVKQLIGSPVAAVEVIDLPSLPLVNIDREWDSENGGYKPTPPATGPDGQPVPRQLDPNRTRQEQDEVYGFKITTSQGACELIFRNSSNGYYGGWCSWSMADMGDNGTIAQLDQYELITEDWSA